MKKSYTVDSTCNDMRIDRWTRLKIGKIPQGLIEKYLRSGKNKINKKKILNFILYFLAMNKKSPPASPQPLTLKPSGC